MGSWANIQWLKVRGRPGPSDPVRGEWAGDVRLEDPEFLFRDARERALGHAEILGEYVFRSMGEPIGEQEGLFLREVAVVEDEQELAPVPLQSLDRVRDAGPEVPEVAFAYVILEGATALVGGGDAARPLSM